MRESDRRKFEVCPEPSRNTPVNEYRFGDALTLGEEEDQLAREYGQMANKQRTPEYRGTINPPPAQTC